MVDMLVLEDASVSHTGCLNVLITAYSFRLPFEREVHWLQESPRVLL